MNFAKRMLMGVGAVAVAGLLGAILTPKAAHGVVATLVQVVNDTTHPVPTAATDARNSFDVTGYCVFNGDVCAMDGAQPLYVVPAGKIAVVETFSGVCVTDGGTPVREARIAWIPNSNNPGTDPNAATFRSWAVPGPGLPTPALGAFAYDVGSFAQNQKTYVSAVSADTSVNVIIFATAGQKGTGPYSEFCNVAISGYLGSQ